MTMADRISTLPDSILCHILSFLPTEQAVATSLLSKRWKPLWLAIPTLNFDDERYSKNRDTYPPFLELVYTVMLLRDVEQIQSIKKFSLNCKSASTFCSSSSVNTWVKAATRRKVEHLSLSLSYTTSLPSCVLTSKTLVVLKLNWLTVDSLSSVSFPSLKILHLCTVRFLEKKYLVEILSACPVLEVLLMKYLSLANISIVEILSACPVLEVLLMKYLSVANISIAHISELQHLPKLVKADISSTSSLTLPLKTFYNVEFLRAEVLSLVETLDLPDHNLVNLTYMELRFFKYSWDWLIKLLRYCPNLQSLVIDKIGGYVGNEENWVHPQYVLECLSSQLKRFSVKKYKGGENELQFIRYIMCNARVLRKVTVCSTSFSNPQEKLQMIKELALCPRGSVTCELYFE